jgi:hypothetical protein
MMTTKLIHLITEGTHPKHHGMMFQLPTCQLATYHHPPKYISNGRSIAAMNPHIPWLHHDKLLLRRPQHLCLVHSSKNLRTLAPTTGSLSHNAAPAHSTVSLHQPEMRRTHLADTLPMLPHEHQRPTKAIQTSPRPVTNHSTTKLRGNTQTPTSLNHTAPTNRIPNTRKTMARDPCSLRQFPQTQDSRYLARPRPSMAP